MEQEEFRRSSSNLSGQDIENNMAMPLRIPKFLVYLPIYFFIDFII